MFNTLRNRLLASYIAILLILLLLIGLIMLVFLRTQPVPTDSIVSDLTAKLLDVRVIESIEIGIGRGGGGGVEKISRRVEGRLAWGQGMMRPFGSVTIQAVETFLLDAAQTRDVRALLITNNGRVYFNSADTFVPDATITEVERSPLVPVTRGQLNGLVRGRFLNPDGSEWLFVAQPVRRFMGTMQSDTPLIVMAAPVPRASLRQVFNTFGDTFFRPLMRAGLIGLLIAVSLALVISSSVARPLNRMSRAARRMAGGDYRQRVRVEGPREVRTLAVSFNEMAGQVAAAQQAQRDFLANVSHDLRTPLTSIQGFSQAIVEGVAADPGSAQHAAQIIQDEAARMHRMVELLLDLARLEAGQLDMQSRAIALSELLHGIGDSLSVKAQQKGLQLDLDVPRGLPRIAGDGDRLAQVFTNLLDNAIKHTPAGGQIALRAADQADGVTVSVQDTGDGIPAADLPRIFERFYQVDKSRQRDRRSGMGLGLAIARQIIEAHGGTIQAASTPGQGTTFTVWLPLPAPAKGGGV